MTYVSNEICPDGAKDCGVHSPFGPMSSVEFGNFTKTYLGRPNGHILTSYEDSEVCNSSVFLKILYCGKICLNRVLILVSGT